MLIGIAKDVENEGKLIFFHNISVNQFFAQNYRVIHHQLPLSDVKSFGNLSLGDSWTLTAESRVRYSSIGLCL
jgi:hypothetical protein